MVILLTGISAPAAVPMEGSLGSHEGRMADRGRTLDWLIMIYMAGDNDLGRDGYKYGNALKMDIEEMESSLPGSGTKVLALTDQEGLGNSALYDIVQDSGPGIVSSKIPLSELDPNWTDELDMADGRTLTRFIVHCMSNYTADRKALIIWDHGSGWYIQGASEVPTSSRGFALDTGNGYSQMYLDDLRSALQQAELELGALQMDLVAFDTCFMGMVEVFYQVAPWFDVGVGSPDEEPFYGYNYTFISSLTSPLTSEGLGSEMVMSFKEEYSNTTYSYPAIGVVDLKVLRGPFRDRLDRLSLELRERMYYLEKVRGGLFNSAVSRTESIGSENLDLGDMLKVLALSDLGKNVTFAVRSCSDIYPELVLDRWTKEDGRNPQGTGLCIYFPYKTLLYKSIYDGTSGFLDLTMDTGWDELIREYQKPVERVHLELEAVNLDMDGLMDDLSIKALDPLSDLDPIPGASVYLDSDFKGRTDGQGLFLERDLSSGTYLVEVYDGSHVGIGTVRIMNRVPVPLVEPAELSTTEGVSLLLDASSSYDPDGDTLLFQWDINASDGLDDVDSTEVTVTFPESEEGVYPVSLTVSDGLEGVSYVRNITVLNGPPVARIRAPSEVVEDETFNLSASGSYDHPTDLGTLEFRFLVDGIPLIEWVFEKDLVWSLPLSGYYTLTVEVRDSSGAISNDSSVIRVRNLAPIPVITGPAMADEDEPLNFSAAGSLDTPFDLKDLAYAWRLDNESRFDRLGPILSVNFTTAGEHRVWVRVTDDDQAAADASMTVQVRNRHPKAGLKTTGTVIEDEPVALDATSSWDTPSDRSLLNCSWDITNDGTWDLFGPVVTTVFSVQGDYEISLRVMDDDGAVSLALGRVKVLNRAPAPNISLPGTIDEDEQLSIDMIGPWDTQSDEGALSCAWWVDGKRVGSERSPPYIVFTTEGEHKVSIEAVDDQGASGRMEQKVLVRNPPPIAEITGLRNKVKEGQKLHLSGSGSRDSVSDQGKLTYQWFIDGKLQEVSGPNVTLGHFKDGTHIIALRVTDDEGAWSEDNASIEVIGRFDIGQFVRSALSPLGLIVGIVLLLVVLGLGTILARRVRDLPTPIDEAPEQEEGLVQIGPTEDKGCPVPVPVPQGSPPLSGSVGQTEDGFMTGSVPPLEVPPFPSDAFGIDIPPPPDTEGLGMPDMSMDVAIPNDIVSKVDT
jgi:hypothetical protein